jgi:Putative transposase/Transposase zinc-binding domain
VSAHRPEVADVFRQHGERFLQQRGRRVSSQQRKALRHIGACGTAALGGHIEQCQSCAQRSIAFNSCRNRHCPRCQSTARDQWLAARARELLPVSYCHVVFTVVSQLRPLALQNPRVFYGLLFRAVGETLLEIAANPRLLGARIGVLAVLHTWSQSLLDHPHIHCLVPAGGLSPDGLRWIGCRKKFFLPVRVLSHKFRGKLLALLAAAFAQGELQLHGPLAELAEPARFSAWLEHLQQIEWVVHAKKPLRRPEHVLKYLARYTYRSAISNGRLLSTENGRVRFRCRNSRQGNRTQTITLDAVEFIRRFLLHVLPCGFVKIRYFGFLAQRHRSAALAHCRQLLAASSAADDPPTILTDTQRRALERRCPLCRSGLLRIVTWLSAAELLLHYPDLVPPIPCDSS